MAREDRSAAVCDAPSHGAPGEWCAALGPLAPAEAKSFRTVLAGSGLGLELHVAPESGSALEFASAAGCGAIFDGAIYNRSELVRDLECGTSLDSDAQLILRAYQRWGEDTLRRVKGIFALVIWDSQANVLLCARDPMGSYPLFYAPGGRRIVVSTRIEGVLAHPDVSPAINRPALADQLRQRWLNSEETLFTAVRRLPPGHLLRADSQGLQIRRYWDPSPVSGHVDWIKEDELERFDFLLDQAVERALQFGPIGVFLSGGLDSVTVAGLATDKIRSRGLPDPLALSLIFPDPESNEEAVQRSVAEQLGLPQLLLRFEETVQPGGLIRAGLEISRTSAMPLLNVWLPAYRYLGREGQRRGCQAILSGTGGDEWLTVSPYLAADLLRNADLAGFYQLWQTLQRSVRRSQLAVLRMLLWSCGAKLLLTQAVRRLTPAALLAERRSRRARALPEWLAPDPALRRELVRREEELQPDPEPDKWPHYVRQMRTALDHPLVSWEMEENFENGRRMGLRMLHPFLDADLVDLLYRTPPLLLNKGGRNKGLVRDSLARRFPLLGFERQKKVEATKFFCSTMLTDGARVWREMGGTRALAEIGVVDQSVLATNIDEILTKNHELEAYQIGHFLNYETWLRSRDSGPQRKE